jgi:hypothetical protein
MGWATFWAIFSQTHLVTLFLTERKKELTQLNGPPSKDKSQFR